MVSEVPHPILIGPELAYVMGEPRKRRLYQSHVHDRATPAILAPDTSQQAHFSIKENAGYGKL